MGPGIPIAIEDTATYVRPHLCVYLACSLTSAEDRSSKNEILEKTARIFADAGFDVHNPAQHTPPGSPHTPSEVYFLDLFHTINADFIFFLRLGRSHGMGIEAQLAADVLLPWGDARADSYTATPLVAGLANAPAICRFTVTPENAAQFYGYLKDTLNDERKLQPIRAVRHARDAAHALVRAAQFGYRVRVCRLVFGLSADTLGKMTGIDPSWIDAIESDARFVSKLTLVQFARLCETLDMIFTPSPSVSTPSFPMLKPRSEIPHALLAAAESFTDYSLTQVSPSTKRPMEDDRLMSQWQAWIAANNLSTLQHQPADADSSVAPIRVYLCPPLSDVNPIEKQSRDRLIEEIRTSLQSLPHAGLVVQIETPKVQETNRDELAPTIYLNRVAKLKETDLAIALLDPASTGVGIMLQLFHNATIPCLCATSNLASVSRMVQGLAPSLLPIIEYSSSRPLGPAIANWLAENAATIRQSQVQRGRAWERLRGLDVRRAIGLTRIVTGRESGTPHGDLRNGTPFLRDGFLDHLIDNQEMVGTLTLLQLAYIAVSQRWQFVPSAAGFLAVEPFLLTGAQIRSSFLKGQSSLGKEGLDQVWLLA